jgi:hypothetical protein
MTNERVGIHDDLPAALDSTNSTAHFSDNSDPHVMITTSDTLAVDLAKRADSGDREEVNAAFSTASPASQRCDTDQPHKFSEPNKCNPNYRADDALVMGLANDIDVERLDKHDDVVDGFPVALLSTETDAHLLGPINPPHKNKNKLQQKTGDRPTGTLNNVTNIFDGDVTINYSAGISKFKTVSDGNAASAGPSASSSPHPNIRKIPKHEILKVHGAHIPAQELAVSA